MSAIDFQSRILEAFKYPRPTLQAKQQFAEEAIKLTARAARCEQFQLALEMNAAVEKMLAAAHGRFEARVAGPRRVSMNSPSRCNRRPWKRARS